MITEKQTPLTDEEIQELVDSCKDGNVVRIWDLVKAVEDAHGINHKVVDFFNFFPDAEDHN